MKKQVRLFLPVLCVLLLAGEGFASEAPLPVRVEPLEDGVIFHYSLSGDASPDDIPIEDVELEGVCYTYSHMTSSVEMVSDTKQITQVVELKSTSNLAQEIVPLLDAVIPYHEDGYSGALQLNLDSISVADGETKTSYYTIKQQRQYPHLASNDSSLIPQSITYNGRTYTCADIQWQGQGYQAIDYQQIPVSYTALVTYTAKASSTTVLDYLVTAEYSGTVSSQREGSVLYEVHFKPVPVAETSFFRSAPFLVGGIAGLLILSACGGFLGYRALRKKDT